MSKKIVLIGNQNCGKTTLFNILTGSFQHIGNFPGVTVEKKTGYIIGSDDELIDLPGIYSLSSYTLEESIAVEYLYHEHIDLIINVVDATCLQRHLYLTMQLRELDIPMILVLNMIDEVKENQNDIDVLKMKEILGLNVIPISASQHLGIDDLLQALKHTQSQKTISHSLYSSQFYQIVSPLYNIIEKKTSIYHLPLHYCLSKVIEGDQSIFSLLHFHQDEKIKVEQMIKEIEKKTQKDRQLFIIETRYQYIDQLEKKCFTMKNAYIHQKSEKIDSILMHHYFGIPIFLFILFLMFYITFYSLGSFLQLFIEKGILFLSNEITNVLLYCNVKGWMISFVSDGLLIGVGSVLSFLPVIILLFFFLSLLEDSGYMARIAFMMDKPLRQIGLSGKAFVPMLMGFGCSVPAIMATRTMSNHRDRLLTVILTPLMSCSARLPIYAMIIGVFFQSKKFAVMIMIYSIGFITLILSSLILGHFVFQGEPSAFLLELPPYRFPTMKNVLLNMKEKAGDFIHKALTIILLSSLIIWFLQSFDLQFRMVEAQDSLLATIGQYLAPFFSPLGLDDWRLSTAFLTGLTAKESVISTLSILTSQFSSLSEALSLLLTPHSAISFLIFSALYMPCIATIAAIKREMNSFVLAIMTVIFQTCIAYCISLLIYQLTLLFL